MAGRMLSISFCVVRVTVVECFSMTEDSRIHIHRNTSDQITSRNYI